MPTKFGESKPAGTSADSSLKDMFEAKIKAEWEAIKNKDKKAYGDLLADDYQGVEVDGRGERTKIQVLNELVDGNVFNYTLWGYKLIPLGRTLPSSSMKAPCSSRPRPKCATPGCTSLNSG